MKAKLTLSINADVIEKAKKTAAGKQMSLSAMVEKYLQQFSTASQPGKALKKGKTITDRIKKITKPVQLSDREMKISWHKHLDEKYGR